MYTPMPIAALFTIVKTWKQPKGPLMDEWTKMMWNNIYTYILFNHKKNIYNIYSIYYTLIINNI